MDPETKTHDIISNNEYTLQMITQGSAMRLKLVIKASKRRTDIYQIVLNSVMDVEKLSEEFPDLQEFKEYISDPSHLEVNLEAKCIRIIQKTERKSKKVNQLAIIKMKYFDKLDKDYDEELIEQILIKCSSKTDINAQDTKELFQKIAMCLNQFIKDKKNTTDYKNQVNLKLGSFQQQLANLRQQIQSKFKQIMTVQQKNMIQNIKILKKTEQQFYQLNKKLKQQFNQKIDKVTTTKQSQFQKINTQINETKQNIRGLQLRKVDKEQIDFIKNLSIDSILQNLHQEIKQAKLQTYQLRNQIVRIQYEYSQRSIQALGKRKQQLVVAQHSKIPQVKVQENEYYKKAENWLHPQTYFTGKYIINENQVTAKQRVILYGKMKIEKFYSFTVTLKKTTNVCLGFGDIQQIKEAGVNRKFLYYSNCRYFENVEFKNHVGKGYKIDQKVTTQVNLEQGFVRWRVGDDIRYQEKPKVIEDKSITWVPFIYLQAKNDCVVINEWS